MKFAQCLGIQAHKQDFASILQLYRSSVEVLNVLNWPFTCFTAFSAEPFSRLSPTSASLGAHSTPGKHSETLSFQSFDGWLVVALHQNPFVPKLLDCTRNKCNCILRCLGIQACREVCTTLSVFHFDVWCCFTFFTHDVIIEHNFWHSRIRCSCLDGPLNSGTTSMSVFCSPRLPDELAAAAIGLTAWGRLLPTEPADCTPTTAAAGEARSLQHRCRNFAHANFHRSPSHVEVVDVVLFFQLGELVRPCLPWALRHCS